MRKHLWNRFAVNFFNGIVILLPVVVTVVVVRFIVTKLNDAILSPLVSFLEPITTKHQHVLVAKTLIFVGVIVLVSLIGWGAKIWFINRIFSLGERMFIRVPFMGRIYKTFKQIFSSLLGQGKTIFKQVVLVEYPRKGIYTLGFTTGVAKGRIKEETGGGINIFVPTTPNPTSGFFLVVPRDEVRFLDMTVEDGMKMVVSGGSVTPERALVPDEQRGTARS